MGTVLGVNTPVLSCSLRRAPRCHMPSFYVWAELSAGLLGCGWIPVVPTPSAHFWQEGTCVGGCGWCSPRRPFWSWACSLGVTLILTQRFPCFSTAGSKQPASYCWACLLPCSTGLSVVPSDAAPWSKGIGEGGVSVIATPCLTLIPSLIFDARKWT